MRVWRGASVLPVAFPTLPACAEGVAALIDNAGGYCENPKLSLLHDAHGDVAQLGERLGRIEEAVGSSPIISTRRKPTG